jgi:hypothetical protein
MSRYRFNLENDQYVVVGWDRPFKSFFWQLWNGNDEKKLSELESKLTFKDEEKDEAIYKELESIYDMYVKYGGEPLIDTRGADGIDYIPTIEQLVQELSKYASIPEDIKLDLFNDQNPGYQP